MKYQPIRLLISGVHEHRRRCIVLPLVYSCRSQIELGVRATIVVDGLTRPEPWHQPSRCQDARVRPREHDVEPQAVGERRQSDESRERNRRVEISILGGADAAEADATTDETAALGVLALQG